MSGFKLDVTLFHYSLHFPNFLVAFSLLFYCKTLPVLSIAYLKMLPIPSLNNPAGPYAVGATTFVRSIPKADQVTIGTGRVHPRDGSGVNSDGTRPALLLEEVAFTAFYPAEVHAPTSWKDRLFGHDHINKGVSWMVEPIDETLKGYEHWLGKRIWLHHPYPCV